MEVKNSLPDPAAAALLADARRLDGEIAGTPATDAPGAPGAGPDAPAALDVEIEGLAATIGAVLGQFFPTVETVLTETECRKLGKKLAPLLTKYGLDRYIAGAGWRVEIEAAIAVVPIVLGVRAAISADLAAMRAAATAAAPAADPPAGAAP